MGKSSVAYSLALENGGVTTYLVEEKIISTVTDTVTFSNLDIIRDGGYVLEILLVPGTSNIAYGIIFNNDTVLSNYINQVLNSYATSVVGTGNVLPNNTITWANSTTISAFVRYEINFIDNKLVTIGHSRTQFSNEYISSNGIRYIRPISNLSSISLQGYINQTTTPVSGGFGAGTIIRLYRKLNGETAAFVPLKNNLVADIIVPSNTTRVDITGLDVNLHGGYHVNVVAGGIQTSDYYLSLYFNNDTNVLNYRTRFAQGYGTSNVGGGGGDNAFLFYLTTTKKVQLNFS